MKQYRGSDVPPGLPSRLRDMLRRQDRFLRELRPARGGQQQTVVAEGPGVAKAVVGGEPSVLLLNGLEGLAVGAPGAVLFARFQGSPTIRSTPQVTLKSDFKPGRLQDVLGLVCDGTHWYEFGRATTVGPTDLPCPVVINEEGHACNPILRIEKVGDENWVYLTPVGLGIGTGTTVNGALDVAGTMLLAGLLVQNVPSGALAGWQLQKVGIPAVTYSTAAGLSQFIIGDSVLTEIILPFARFGSHVLPFLNDFYDLGSDPAYRWRALYTNLIDTNDMRWKTNTIALTANQGAWTVPSDGGRITRVTTAAGTFQVFGIAVPAGVDGNTQQIINVGPNPITIRNDSASATAPENRILTGVGDFNLPLNGVMHTWYDSISQRWRVLA